MPHFLLSSTNFWNDHDSAGLAFSDDLATPVEKLEAERFVSVVQLEAEKILPGVIVQLCGGLRRSDSV